MLETNDFLINLKKKKQNELQNESEVYPERFQLLISL